MALLDYDAVTAIGDNTDPIQITLSGQSLAIAESAIALMRDEWLWTSWDEQVVDDLDKCLAELQTVTQAGGDLVIGMIIFWPGGTSFPPNLLVCDGSEFDIEIYPELHALLVMDHVPDLLDRFLRMSTIIDVLHIGGSNTHVLSMNEMPRHRHVNSARGVISWEFTGATAGLVGGTEVKALDSDYQGADNAHNNQPAYITLTPCIVAR